MAQFKLGALLIKQLSKPLSTRIKAQSKNSALFQAVSVKVGRFVYQTTTRLNLWNLGHKVKNIKPLTEQEAINRGSDVLGEVVVYSVSAGLIVYEYRRRDLADDVKKANKADRRAAKEERMRLRFEALEVQIHVLQQRCDELEEGVDGGGRNDAAPVAMTVGDGGGSSAAPGGVLLAPFRWLVG